MGLAAALLLSVPAQAATQTKAVRKAHTLHAVKNLAKSQSLIGDKAVKRLMLEKEKKEAQLPDLQKQLIEKEQEEAWVNGQAPWKAQAQTVKSEFRTNRNGQNTGKSINARALDLTLVSTAASMSRGPLKNIESEEEVDEHGIIITPDKGEHKFYTRAGTAYYAQSGSVYSQQQSGRVELVETPDGTVYVKNIVSLYTTDAWVKGTIDNNVLTIPVNQPVAYSTNYATTLSVCWGSYDANNENNHFPRLDTPTITFTINGDVLTLQGSDEDTFVGVYWDDDNSFQGYGDFETVWTLDADYEPLAVYTITPPEGLQTETWYTTGDDDGDNTSGEVNLGFDGSDVYIQGIFEEFPEAWVKGTIDGTTVTFDGLQYQGIYSSTYEIYAVGADAAATDIENFTMTYDAVAGTFTANNCLLANASTEKIYALHFFDSFVITREAPAPFVVDELPYLNTLTTKDEFGLFTVIDANEDGKTWNFDTSYGTYYIYNGSLDGDDWLISPAIKLEAGKKYHVSLDAKNSGYPERFEVKLGAEATAEAMTTEVIPATDVTTKEFVTSEADAVTVAEDGYYYFGIHAISDADEYRLIVANFLVEQALEPTAPAAVTDLTVVPFTEEIGAAISFTAPSTAIDGSALTDNLTKVEIYRDGQVIKTFGEGAEIDWVAADQGYTNAQDITDIDLGDGITATAAKAGGTNAPKYYTSGTSLRLYAGNTFTLTGATFKKVVFTFTNENNKMSLEADKGDYSLADGIGTWTGEADEIVFSVPNVSGTQARIQSIHIETAGGDGIAPGATLSYDDLDEELTIGNYTYYVLAYNASGAGKKSEEVEVFLSKLLTVPYVADLTDSETFGYFNVIDANSDNSTWGWSSNYGTYYYYNSTNAADDYLVSMPIKLEAGKNYNVAVTAKSAGYTEAFEVVLGTKATVAGLSTAILDEVIVENEDFETFENVFTVSESGNYYVAIHATSPADQFILNVSQLAIEEGPADTAPAAPEVTVVPDPEGALKATINITASTVDFAGNALTGNTDFQILRNDEPVGTITGIAPGAEASFVNEVDSAYFYTYQVIASNADGEGGKSEKIKVFVGTDVPVAVENLAAADQGTSIVFTWDKVGNVGMNGGYVNPANVDYNLWSLKIESFYGFTYLDFDELLSTQRDAATTTFETDTEEGEQDFSYYAIQTANETGEGDASVAALITGKSYDLPVIEGFTGSSFHYLWDYNGDITGSTDTSDGDDLALNFYSEVPGIYYFATGKLNLKSAANPYLFFDVKSPSVSQIAVIGSVDGGEAAPLQTVNVTDEYTTVKVPLTELRNGRYAQAGFIYEIVNPTEINNNINWGDTLLADNFKIVDLLEYDMVIDATAPATVKAGTTAQVKLAVTNQGDNAAKNYTVKLLKGEEEIFSETVADELGFYETKEFTVDYPTTIFTEAGDVTLTAKVIYENDLDEDNNITEVSFTVVTPSQTPVSDLAAAQQENTIVATWTAPEASAAEITEDFEDTTVFPEFSIGGITADQQTGAFGNWTVYDGNNMTVYGFQNITVPNLGSEEAWIVFAPGSDQLSQDMSEGYPAHSGNQFLASFCPADNTSTPAADHWLISPELSGVSQTISFFARVLTDNYGAESFEVLYSTTDAQPASFTKVGGENITTTEWTEFSYSLPEGTKYFAIRHTSQDIFALFIDDITYFGEGSAPESFNVYLDEELVANVAEPPATIENITNGSHKVSVTAVYASGESAPVSVTVEVSDVVGIDQILASGKKVDVYSTDGRMVRQQATSLSGLKSGVYVIDNKKVVVK